MPCWDCVVSPSQRSGSGSSFRLGAAALGALLVGGVTVAACERVVEQSRGADNVNYDEVRKAIEDALEKEGYDDGSYGPVLVRLAWHSAGTYDKKKGKFGQTTTKAMDEGGRTSGDCVQSHNPKGVRPQIAKSQNLTPISVLLV